MSRDISGFCISTLDDKRFVCEGVIDISNMEKVKNMLLSAANQSRYNIEIDFSQVKYLHRHFLIWLFGLGWFCYAHNGKVIVEKLSKTDLKELKDLQLLCYTKNINEENGSVFEISYECIGKNAYPKSNTDPNYLDYFKKIFASNI